MRSWADSVHYLEQCKAVSYLCVPSWMSDDETSTEAVHDSSVASCYEQI